MKKRDPIDEQEEALSRKNILEGKRRQAAVEEKIFAALPVDELDVVIDAALASVLRERLELRARRRTARGDFVIVLK